jgi:hypothetical protein
MEREKRKAEKWKARKQEILSEVLNLFEGETPLDEPEETQQQQQQQQPQQNNLNLFDDYYY